MAEVYLETCIKRHLLDDPYLASKLGDDAVYFSVLPQDANFSAIVISEISGFDPSPTHDGHSGIEKREFQFTIFATCVLKLVEIRVRLEKYLDSKAVEVGAPDGVWCGRIAKTGQRDMGQNPGRTLYMYSMDFQFWEKVQR